MKILIIEDDYAARGFLKKFLAENHTVDAVDSGKEGLEKLAKTAYDLVILDYMMPDMNGMEVFRQIDPHIPVIMLTAIISEKLAREFMAAGGADFMIKPLIGSFEIHRLRMEYAIESFHIRREWKHLQHVLKSVRGDDASQLETSLNTVMRHLEDLRHPQTETVTETLDTLERELHKIHHTLTDFLKTIAHRQLVIPDPKTL
ncbi:MAG: response regulator [Gemmatimonadetes bacterium]|nr:MAG: response regulator [Gemmatimonadota bacterium]